MEINMKAGMAKKTMIMMKMITACRDVIVAAKKKIMMKITLMKTKTTMIMVYRAGMAKKTMNTMKKRRRKMTIEACRVKCRAVHGAALAACTAKKATAWAVWIMNMTKTAVVAHQAGVHIHKVLTVATVLHRDQTAAAPVHPVADLPVCRKRKYAA
jgi:hypothetical protein